MRIFIAAISILLGALALVVGIGQRTFWAPPETVTATVQTELKDAPLTVVEPGVAEIEDRPVDVTIEADGEFTAALGRSSDVDAWVGKAAHNTISGIDSEAMSLTAEHSKGEAKVPNPKNSDLWVASESADSHMVHRWTEPDEGDWSLLLAADGTKAAPTEITVSWENDATAPFSIPLIIVGSLLVLFGLATVLVGRRGRGQGPEGSGSTGGGSTAPTAGSGTGSSTLQRTATVVAAAALVLIPAGPASAATNSASDSPSESSVAQDQEGAGSYAVLQEDQLDRILESISDTVSSGDKARDAKKLTARVGGDALSLRKTNYSQRSDGLKIPAPGTVAAAPIRSAAVTTTTKWPRTAMIVTQAKDAKIPRVLVLKQDDPRANYKLINEVSMLPGSEFPGLAVGDTSVRTLGVKDGSLMSPPATAAKDLATFLGDAKSKKKSQFAESAFITATQKGQAKEIKENKNAKIKYEHAVDAKSLEVLSTPNGGALVSGQLTSTMTATPKEEGGTVKLDDASAKLADAKTTKKGVVTTSAEPVVFYIPGKDSKDKIRLIAGESALVSSKVK
ncbi:hypothetical protein [Arthrobacter rhombi]|uniref:hypothetical protein n=1 Tax=Arthrobacter rhombi TaxID=71253 RepID=UPI003FD2DFC4